MRARRDLSEHVPPAWADVFLLDGAPMHADPGAADVVGGVEEAVEVLAHLLGLVKRSAELDGDRDLGGHGLSDGFEDADRARGLAEPVPASRFLADLLDGAGEVHVDGRERALGDARVALIECSADEFAVVLGLAGALLEHLDGRRRHLRRFGAHDLPRERVVFVAPGHVVGKVAQVGFHESPAAPEQGQVEQGFGDAVGAAVPAGDDPHRGV